MTDTPITPPETVTAYGILLAVGALAVLGALCILAGLKWLGRDRD